MTRAPRILFVLTNAQRIAASSKPTGTWLHELAAPYYVFLDAGCELTFASPLGGSAPIDPESREAINQSDATQRFEADAKTSDALNTTTALSQLSPASFDALYFPGGHGTMQDFPTAENIRAWVEAFYVAGKPVASVCHGVACLVSAHKADGTPLIAGHRFTCFSDAEESAIGLTASVPFLLESRLGELGGTAICASPFQRCAVTDGMLVTGQNPASAAPAAASVLHLLHATA